MTQLRAIVETLKTENKDLNSESAMLHKLKQGLSAELAGLKCKVSHMEHYSHLNNLEIFGFPVMSGENVYAIHKAVADGLKILYRE